MIYVDLATALPLPKLDVHCDRQNNAITNNLTTQRDKLSFKQLPTSVHPSVHPSVHSFVRSFVRLIVCFDFERRNERTNERTANERTANARQQKKRRSGAATVLFHSVPPNSVLVRIHSTFCTILFVETKSSFGSFVVWSIGRLFAGFCNYELLSGLTHSLTQSVSQSVSQSVGRSVSQPATVTANSLTHSLSLTHYHSLTHCHSLTQ